MTWDWYGGDDWRERQRNDSELEISEIADSKLVGIQLQAGDWLDLLEAGGWFGTHIHSDHSPSLRYRELGDVGRLRRVQWLTVRDNDENLWSSHDNNNNNKSSRSEAAYVRQREYGLDPGLLPKFNGDFLVQRYICDKIFMKIWSLSLEI